MPAPNLAPILAAAPEAPSRFAYDREAGADGFALLLAFFAGAPAASGGPSTNQVPPAGGANASVATRTVGPATTPGGVVSSGVGEAVPVPGDLAKLDLDPPAPDGAATGGPGANPSPPPVGGDAPLPTRAVGPAFTPRDVLSTAVAEAVAAPGGFEKLGLDPPDPDGAASGGPTGPVAAGEPSGAASAVESAGFVPPGPGRFPDGSVLGLPSSSPASRSPSTGVPRSSLLATAPLPYLPATASAEPVARPQSAPIRKLASFEDPVSGTAGAGSAIAPLAGAGGEAAASPSGSSASGPLSVGEPMGLAAGASGPLVHAAGSVGRPARVSAGPLSAEDGPMVSPAAPHPSRPVALSSAAGETSRGANLPDAADRSTSGPVVQRPSQPLIEGAFVATAGTEPSLAPGDPAFSRPVTGEPFQGPAPAPVETAAVGLPASSAALARAGGGDPEATVAQPLAAADPAGSPSERVAAAGSVKVAESGGRSPGGSAEAGVGGGSDGPADPGSSLDLAEVGSAPVFDLPSLPGPAPAGGTAEPLVPPRLPSVPAPQPPAVQVAATLLQRDGVPSERLRIALEPAELGSVELTLTSEGRRKARALVLVERPETLELLQRDQRTLERILVASGLELEPGGLEFGLRRDGEGRREAFAPPSDGAGPSEPIRPGPAVTPPRLLDLRLLDLVV